MTKIKDVYGRETNLAYSGGLLQPITDPAGRVVTCGYSAGKLTSITDPDPDTAGPLAAPVTTYAYGATSGLMTQATDPLNHSVQYEYTFADRLDKRIYPLSIHQRVEPVMVKGLIDVAAGQGTQSNPAAIPAPSQAIGKIVYPLSRTVEVTTDRFGNYLTHKDPLGNVTTWVRNADGLATQMTSADPDGAGRRV